MTRTGEWEISAISWRLLNNPGELACMTYTGIINSFPFLGILGYLKNTHKNPKFGKVRQVPTREFPTKFPDWDLSHSSKLGFLWAFFKFPKISKNGNRLFFPVAPVVQKVDSAIHQINLYPLDSAIGFPNTYPLDSDLSG